MRWIVSLSIVVMACGGVEIPEHNGYKPKETQPWKKPKVLKLDDKQEAKAEGDLSYPAMKRAKWFELNLPSAGQLALTLEITPPGDTVNEDFDLGMEVLDPGFNVIAKSNLEDEDAHEINKKKTIGPVAAGKYLIHLYLQSRLDTADFVLRASFKSTGPIEAKTNFPAQVEFVPTLPMVPLTDDKPASAVVVKPPRHPQGGNTPPPPPPPPPLKNGPTTARIIGIQVVGKGAVITLATGTQFGAHDGMKASLSSVSGSFPLSNCADRTCSATIGEATLDQIKAAHGVVSLSQ